MGSARARTSGQVRAGRLAGLVLGALIAAASLVVYAPVLQPDTRFLWDDDSELWGHRGHLVQDTDGLLKAWFPVQRPEAGWHRIWEWQPQPGLGFWPLTPTVFWLEWRLWNADDRWEQGASRVEKIAAVEAIAYRFHIPNVLFHALAAILAWLVLARLGLQGAWLAGLVFALHPVHVPSVAWVSELKNTLSLPLLLVSLLLFLRHDERPRRWLLASSLLAFFLSLCAKTSGVAFPFVLLGCAWWRRGRIARRDLLRAAPFFVVAFLMGLSTLWFVQGSGGLSELVVPPENFLHRLAGAGWIPWFYGWRTLFPSDLMMIYPRFEIVWRSALAYLPGLALLAILACAWRWRASWGTSVLFAVGSFVALLFPVLGFFEMTFMMHSPVSDHFNYISMLPLLALVIGGTRAACASRPPAVWAWRAAAVGLVLVFACMTWQRAFHFKNHIALWSHNVAVNPDAWMAQYNLGSSLIVEADRLEPGPESERRYSSALAHLQRAVKVQPGYERAHYRLGTALGRVGRDAEAIEAWLHGIEIATRKADGPSLLQAGRYRREVALAASRLGRLDLAQDQYRLAINLMPTAWRLYLELGGVLERLGDERGARSSYMRVLSQQRHHFDAQVSLALLLASAQNESIRNGKQALVYAERARSGDRELDVEQHLRVLHALAAAHAERAWAAVPESEDGFQIAADFTRRAIEMARESHRPDDVVLATARLHLYENGQPLRRESGSAAAD